MATTLADYDLNTGLGLTDTLQSPLAFFIFAVNWVMRVLYSIRINHRGADYVFGYSFLILALVRCWAHNLPRSKRQIAFLGF